MTSTVLDLPATKGWGLTLGAARRTIPCEPVGIAGDRIVAAGEPSG